MAYRNWQQNSSSIQNIKYSVRWLPSKSFLCHGGVNPFYCRRNSIDIFTVLQSFQNTSTLYFLWRCFAIPFFETIKFIGEFLQSEKNMNASFNFLYKINGVYTFELKGTRQYAAGLKYVCLISSINNNTRALFQDSTPAFSICLNLINVFLFILGYCCKLMCQFNALEP